jgi:hypothetical protein
VTIATSWGGEKIVSTMKMKNAASPTLGNLPDVVKRISWGHDTRTTEPARENYRG